LSREIISVLAPCRSLLIWQRRAGGDASGNIEGDETFAEARIADQKCNFADRDSAGSEPLDRPRRDVGGVADVGRPRFGRLFEGGTQLLGERRTFGFAVGGGGWHGGSPC
jgi:hypothetical protein